MEIGIHGYDHALVDWYRELGVSWTKWPASLEPETVEDQRARMEQAREDGLRVVVDMRTSAVHITSRQQAAFQGLVDAGKIVKEAPGDTPAVVEEKIRHNQEAATHVALAELHERAYRYVALHKDLCNDYEFWGECQCPWTSRGVFDRYACYPSYLAAVAAAAKSASPGCRVWTGGNGMNLDPNPLLSIMQEERGGCFDVANWHPYFMSVRDLKTARDIMIRSFGEVRKSLQLNGRDQPYACTEWGYPTHAPNLPEGVIEYLRSNVVMDGVRQLTAEEAVEWFEQDLSLMEEFGFEVVVVHELFDRPSTTRHWGEFCGLVTADGVRKPTFGVIQRWADKGRSGRPAFAAYEEAAHAQV
jgi:hypothetical protein